MDEAVTVGHSRNSGCTLPILRMKLGNQEQRCGKSPKGYQQTNGRDPPPGTVPASSIPHAKGRAEGTAEVAAEGSRECNLGMEKREA